MKTAVAVMALAVIVLAVGIVYMYRPEKSYPFRGTILSEITNGLSDEACYVSKNGEKLQQSTGNNSSEETPPGVFFVSFFTVFVILKIKKSVNHATKEKSLWEHWN